MASSDPEGTIYEYAEAAGSLMLANESITLRDRTIVFEGSEDDFLLLVARAFNAALHTLPYALLVDVLQAVQRHQLCNLPFTGDIGGGGALGEAASRLRRAS
jgi:hypothetical protein